MNKAFYLHSEHLSLSHPAVHLTQKHLAHNASIIGRLHHAIHLCRLAIVYGTVQRLSENESGRWVQVLGCPELLVIVSTALEITRET